MATATAPGPAVRRLAVVGGADRGGAGWLFSTSPVLVAGLGAVVMVGLVDDRIALVVVGALELVAFVIVLEELVGALVAAVGRLVTTRGRVAATGLVAV